MDKTIEQPQTDINHIGTLLYINNTLRTSIKISLAIHKRLINFYPKDINELFRKNQNSANTTKTTK